MSTENTAQYLFELRGERSLQQIAEAIGVTTESLSEYEKGLRLPNDSVKIKIADYYGVDVAKLFNL